MALNAELRQNLETREREGLRRTMRLVPAGTLDLASNDYLGLARDERVIEAACAAVRTYGAGARASRLLSGHTEIHAELEKALASLKGCEAALVFPSGYQANLAVIPSLAGADDAVYCDKRNHASLIDACRLAEAHGTTVRYYNSGDSLAATLARTRAANAPRRLIVSDTVFSMDGDLSELPYIHQLAIEYDCTLILDDAHGTGTLGRHGSGALEYFQDEYGAAFDKRRIIHIGTLSKAIGSQGGFVAGSQDLINWLVNEARTFIFTTGLNPAACGAALESLKIIEAEPERRERLRDITRRLGDGLRGIGLKVRAQASPIMPVPIGEAARAVNLSAALSRHGVWCPAIRPPTVPLGTSRLRVSSSTILTDEDVARIPALFKDAMRELEP